MNIQDKIYQPRVVSSKYGKYIKYWCKHCSEYVSKWYHEYMDNHLCPLCSKPPYESDEGQDAMDSHNHINSFDESKELQESLFLDSINPFAHLIRREQDNRTETLQEFSEGNHNSEELGEFNYEEENNKKFGLEIGARNEHNKYNHKNKNPYNNIYRQAHQHENSDKDTKVYSEKTSITTSLLRENLIAMHGVGPSLRTLTKDT